MAGEDGIQPGQSGQGGGGDITTIAGEFYDFRILINTENGVSRSYAGYQQISSSAGYVNEAPIFINVYADKQDQMVDNLTGAWAGGDNKKQWVFTTSEMGNKIRFMVSCSYNDNEYISGSFNYVPQSSKRFGEHEPGLYITSE